MLTVKGANLRNHVILRQNGVFVVEHRGEKMTHQCERRHASKVSTTGGCWFIDDDVVQWDTVRCGLGVGASSCTAFA